MVCETDGLLSTPQIAEVN